MDRDHTAGGWFPVIADCAPVVDWAGDFGHRLWLDQGCPAVEVVVDTWPLATAVAPGPIPGPGTAYDAYARIRQGPNTQEVISLLAGAWTPIPAATLAADECSGQVDLSYLEQGRPEYPAGTVLSSTPTYRGLIPGGAWVVALPCTPPVVPPAPTQPPTTTTTTTRPVPKSPPRISCETPGLGGCNPTTTITGAPPPAPPATVVAPPSPTLPATGVGDVTKGLAVIGGLFAVAGVWCLVVARIWRRK